MSKQRIANNPEILNFLLNEEIPISERLAKHNEYDCLAFIDSPKNLYHYFDKLVDDNENYVKAFYVEKQKAIDAIQDRQKNLNYEAFVKYLFYEKEEFKNKRVTHEKKEDEWLTAVIFDITPNNIEQIEILERVSIEYAKANEGSFFKKPSRFGKKNLLVPFISFDNLKIALQESLGKPYADKEQVISDYKKQYLEPLQDTENESKAQTIYRNFKTGKSDSSKERDYFYYATKGAVMELLKFEKYLGQSSNWEQEANDYRITKQSAHFFKYTQNYIFSEAEKRRIELHLKKEDAEAYYKMKVADVIGDYKITFKPEIDKKINSALKRDYSVFNERNKNFRFKSFNFLGEVEIFKIHSNEYLIEGKENEKGNYTISIYNYEYSKKWLKFLNDLMGNYCFGQLPNIKEDILEDAKTKQINGVEDFADAIDNIFFHCLDFHNNKRFEGINNTTERNILFRYINMPGGIFWWKQEKERELNISIGNLLKRLEDLFISTSPNNFMQIRDFISLWIDRIVDQTINNDSKKFQWGYSPFMEDVLNLNSKIKELFPDDRIRLKYDLHKTTNTPIDIDTIKPLLTKIVVETKPTFRVESIEQIFDLLKDHFSIEDQSLLFDLLKIGCVLDTPILFKGNGNRLADAFKQLYDADIITGCQKKELESWIAQNFKYIGKNSEAVNFKIRYLNDIISSNNDRCKKPILEVKRTSDNYIIIKA